MDIHLFVPTFEVDECLTEIRECLERGWTGLGYKTVEFETSWLGYTGHAHAHFVNSATAALHLAVNVLRTLDGWADGDEIITSPLTFVSTNFAILYENLIPVFADVDESLCLDPADIERKITPRTRAVMFVGLGGNTGQLDAVRALCRRRGLKLILDAAHMAGATQNGRTPEADAVCYSFQAVKNLPTADSGMVCFADAEADALCRKKAWMGISKDTYTRTHDVAAYRWRYDVEHTGWKYNGNSIMAAMGLVQLRYLDRDNALRRHLAERYEAGFKHLGTVETTPIAVGCQSARHLFQIQVEARDAMMVALNGEGIFPGVHYQDNRRFAPFARPTDDCPRASRAADRLISLPLHLRLTPDDIDRVVDAVRRHAG